MVSAMQVTMSDLPLCFTNKELLDKTVYDIFDELFTIVATSHGGVHPSEEVGREKQRQMPFSKSKIYDCINSYHAFCKLCEQHFYKCSVVHDINSFFQNHLNTPYHRQLRSACPCPKDVPIFSWEVPLVSARCNLCGLSGLKAFVVSTTFPITDILAKHICVWPRDQRENNESCMAKLNLLKKYCGLSVFREKFIRKINVRNVCLLCEMMLPWVEDKVVCHLQSDRHFQKFCELIRMKLNFRLTDVLNGFNLETVTRFMLTYQLPMVSSFTDYIELAVCLSDSNSAADPYVADVRSTGFSPSYVESQLQNLNSDFIYNKTCLLCECRLEPRHFQSPVHLAKVAGLSKASFHPDNYRLHLQLWENRLQPLTQKIIDYAKLKKKLEVFLKSKVISTEDENPKVPLEPQRSDATDWITYLMTQLGNKLEPVTQVETVSEAYVFCQVCDQFMKQSYLDVHLNSEDHREAVMKQNELMEDCSNQRYWDPFKKVHNATVCLLCPAVVDNFLLHLKNDEHTRQLQLYCGFDLKIPISSMFKFRDDHSCFCTICNRLLAKNSVSLKALLKEVRSHFPCPEMQKWQKDLAVSEATKPRDDEKCDLLSRLELESVERAVAGVFGEFEKTVIENVCKKSLTFLKSVTKSDLVKSGAPVVQERSTPPTYFCASPSSSDDDRKDNLDSSKQETTEKTAEREKKDKKTKVVEENQMIKVMVIKGLVRRKKNSRFIRACFSSLAEVLFIVFKGENVIVGFFEEGVVEKAAEEAKVRLEEPKVNVTVMETTVENIIKKEGKKLPALKKELEKLLQEPFEMMQFILSLISRVESASKSPVERKREEELCSMIVRTTRVYFPCCRCYPFGSRLTGLSVSSSDLDVFLDCGNMYDGFSNVSQKSLMRKVEMALRKNKEVSHVTVVSRARVPIVSFFHKPTELQCDLSFKSGLSIHKSMLLKFLISVDWRVKPLILFIKHWAVENELHGRPFFSSYALSMLVVNYLEQLEPPVLPTIDSLQNSYIGIRKTIDGWDCNINQSKKNFPRFRNMEPLPSLLVGFFEFYANFNFVDNVVFPLNGKALLRKAFSVKGKSKLPFCFKRHILNIPPPIGELVPQKYPVCIIDPFDLSHVMTRGFPANGLRQFQHLCTLTVNILKKVSSKTLD